MFHSTDSVFFRRLEDGSVEISKRTPNADPSAISWPVVWSHVLPKGIWCSAVASVSAKGETGPRWIEACHFHDPEKDATK